MNSFTLLLVCALACFQNALCDPGVASAYPWHNSNHRLIDPYFSEPCVNVVSNDLVIRGKAQVCGSMPFSSSVQLSGNVPSAGFATIKNACNCRDAYLR